MKNIIPEFIQPEIDYIIKNANFKERERMLFEMRNNECPIEECAELLNVAVSTAKRINKKMMVKIMKVIENMDI